MKYTRYFLYLTSVLFILFLIITGMQFHQPEQEFIRFHVIANSDSPADQELKLRVRYRLLEDFTSELSGIESINQGRKRIAENLREIKNAALQEIKSSGSSYPVEVKFGRFQFPTKAYGDLVLPAGEYDALKVVIGQGKGANWWCVMFPPLCFVDISHGIAHKPQPGEHDTEANRHRQQQVQTGQHSGLLGCDEGCGSQTGDETIQQRERVEYRWKILEWWKGSREKVESILSFLNIT